MAAATPGTPPMRPMRHRSTFVLLALLACALLLPGCASTNKGEALQRAQYAWSAAIRTRARPRRRRASSKGAQPLPSASAAVA